MDLAFHVELFHGHECFVRHWINEFKYQRIYSPQNKDFKGNFKTACPLKIQHDSVVYGTYMNTLATMGLLLFRVDEYVAIVILTCR